MCADADSQQAKHLVRFYGAPTELVVEFGDIVPNVFLFGLVMDRVEIASGAGSRAGPLCNGIPTWIWAGHCRSTTWEDKVLARQKKQNRLFGFFWCASYSAAHMRNYGKVIC